MLLGRRYDSLCEKFDSPMPAVGFAADVEALAVLMSPEEREALPVTVIHGEDGYEMEAQKLLSQLTAEGKNCESSVFETREEARAYAAAIGAAALISVGKETKEGDASVKPLRIALTKGRLEKNPRWSCSSRLDWIAAV